MIIKCKICENEIEIADNTADGQRFLCPYCREKFEYRRPTRVELPVGLPAEKPKLSVRRSQPQQNAASEAEQPNGLVQRVEARAKANARKARAAKLKAFFTNIFALVVLVGIGWGGYEIWKIHKGAKTVNLPPVVSVVIEKVLPPPEDAEDAANEGPQPSQEELAEQEAARQREMERKRQHEEEERLRAIEKKQSAEYFAVRESFVGARLAYWSELPKNRRPGAVEGAFGLAVPRGRGKCEYFQVASTTNGVTVRRLSEKVPPQDVPESEYKKLMMNHGGFFLIDGTAYFVSGSNDKKSWTPPTRYSESFGPAKALFDDAYSIVGDRSLDTTGRSFEVFFSLDDKSQPIRIGEVPFDGEIRYAAFAEVAKGIALNMRKTGKKPKARTIKRTVVFYDGTSIQKDIRGVTKIPRTWTQFEQGYSRASYWRQISNQYQALREEAWRQEREAEQAEAEFREAMEKWQRKRDAPPTESEIQSILYAGAVTIKRK